MLSFCVPVIEFPRIFSPARGSTVKGWLSQNWLGLVILALLGWGGSQLVSINERLAALEKGQTEIEKRIDRISKTLPDIRVKVAYESVYGPFETAILVQRPNKDTLGSWGIDFHLFDSETGSVLNFRSEMRGRREEQSIMVIKGWLHNIAYDLTSLQEIEKFAIDLEQPTFIPGSLLADASGISHVELNEFTDEAELKIIDARLVNRTEIGPVRNWSELSKFMQLTGWLVSR